MMAIIGKSTYFVSGIVGIHRHTVYQIECVLYTEAQPNLIVIAFLPEHWTANQQAAQKVHLCSASKDSDKAIWKITYMYVLEISLRKSNSTLPTS